MNAAPYGTARRNDPRARPVPRDVWTQDDGSTLLVVATTATHVLVDSDDAPSRFLTLADFRSAIVYARLTTDGASIPAMLAALDEAEHEAMLAVSDTLADLGLGMPHFPAACEHGLCFSYWLPGGDIIITYAYDDGTGRASWVVDGKGKITTNGSTPRAAVEALLAEVARA